ncbi:RloB family protein [Candidatus Albibeggiatoa sp. nov. NOAA]|uniref:RloB family protein n=1 Tax=Candidatus Albibeggiatoa sp. nov. NOAA TaxID=3162724 RepID=UPI0032F3A0EC|nr:RloB family protein [Thiotrichaceae bacterium]
MPKKRNKVKRNLKPVLHIYCEGEKTEPNYISGYINQKFPTNRRLQVIKVEPTKKNTPKQLVDEAIKKDKDCPADDIFWVVYDRESEQKYKQPIHKEAYNKAQKHGINIALSNVCFEVWLLLHFQSSVAHYHSDDDLRKNSSLRQEFKKRGLKDYEKGNPNIFHIISSNIDNARQRAKKLNQNTINSADVSWTKPYQLNPYTDMYKLLDAIDEFGEQYIS